MGRHNEWLNLVERSGPFLTNTVLDKHFPQGMDKSSTSRARMRSAYEEWCDAIEEEDAQLPALHQAWTNMVLQEVLEFDDTVLKSIDVSNSDFVYSPPEHSGSFAPDLVFHGNSEKPQFFVSILPPGTDIEKVASDDKWPAPIVEKMTLLCRANDVRLGLVTNGERWMLVNAPTGSTSSHISWYARLWFHEPITYNVFHTLLGASRWYGPEENRLPIMLEESLKHQEEVTTTLGEQVRRAVEVLVQCLDKADQDRNRELLHDVSPAELYEAGLTVMMRLVFALCAEERGLLLLDEPTYARHYAINTLRGHLAEEADRHGPEVLERRHDAWARLLSVFRAIYGGVEHETLRMPALGGSLFDPDRFPFLEGRAKGTFWKETIAQPLPIDNRTVMLLLNALQVLEQPGGALLLSYKALDVEQIGHVYEGLLEHTVKRMASVTLGIEGSQKAKNPNLTLDELEATLGKGEDAIIQMLEESTLRSPSALKNALRKVVDDDTLAKVTAPCGGDMVLANRIRPFVNLLRKDAWGEFIVYPEGAFAVTLGSDRRETGTHYTPKSLTESIVQTTLEPIVYTGPAEGKFKEEWLVKSSAELLDLKICDPAMGSGAFLVQVCRYLSERVVEAWGHEEVSGKSITVDGDVLDALEGGEPMPASLDERLTIARRLIAERCLYGVDLNPLAVELAKLSIWLITLSKGRPFGFLDHNLRSGDSLLGIHDLEQLYSFDLKPQKGTQTRKLFAQDIEDHVKAAIELRRKIRETPIRDILDVQNMERLDREARRKLENIEHIADAIIGLALSYGGNSKILENKLGNLSILATGFIQGDNETGKKIIAEARKSLSIDLPVGKLPRNPFHWPIEFPEVFSSGGFDVIIGNPPFLWGLRIAIRISVPISHFLKKEWPHAKKNADLCTYFLLRSNLLLKSKSSAMGFITTKSIAESDNKETSLDYLVSKGWKIFCAKTDIKWPGTAMVIVSTVNFYNGRWHGFLFLNNKCVKNISTSLSDEVFAGTPKKLLSNKSKCFQGSVPLGDGFFLSEDEVNHYVKIGHNSDVIFPYITGMELNNSYLLQPSRWVIYFRDWSLEECANYPELLTIVKERVKPQRDKIIPKNNMAKQRKELWWKFTGPTVDLYKAISVNKMALASAVVGKHHAFVYIPANYIFANTINIFSLCDYAHFTVLHSCCHMAWALHQGSKLGDTPRYNVSDCFETFPFPLLFAGTDTIGKEYDEHRKVIMFSRKKGLTDTYNCLHDPKDLSDDFKKFRELHIEVDMATVNAYGWSDLDLDHNFYETKQGIRFTISEDSRREILQRLLKLNHERYEEEFRQGLHDKVKNKFKSKNKPNNTMSILDKSPQGNLF